MLLPVGQKVYCRRFIVLMESMKCGQKNLQDSHILVSVEEFHKGQHCDYAFKDLFIYLFLKITDGRI